MTRDEMLEFIGSLPGTPAVIPETGQAVVEYRLPDNVIVYLPKREAEQDSRPAGELDRGTSQN